MKYLFPSLLALVASCLAVATPLPQKADLLASNTVVAEYVGTVHQACRFMTALCPNHCDHAADLAHFRVLENKEYVCNSQYGDDKTEPGSMLVADATKNIPGQDDEAVHQTLSCLKPGDKVSLTLAHYYVQENGTHYPVRPITHLEQIPSSD